MTISTFLLIYVSLFPVSWFLIGLVDLFIKMERSPRLKMISGVGEKILYSGIALFFAGLYDLIITKTSFDALLFFISFPVAWVGMKMIYFSQEKKSC